MCQGLCNSYPHPCAPAGPAVDIPAPPRLAAPPPSGLTSVTLSSAPRLTALILSVALELVVVPLLIPLRIVLVAAIVLRQVVLNVVDWLACVVACVIAFLIARIAATIVAVGPAAAPVVVALAVAVAAMPSIIGLGLARLESWLCARAPGPAQGPPPLSTCQRPSVPYSLGQARGRCLGGRMDGNAGSTIRRARSSSPTAQAAPSRDQCVDPAGSHTASLRGHAGCTRCAAFHSSTPPYVYVKETDVCRGHAT